MTTSWFQAEFGSKEPQRFCDARAMFRVSEDQTKLTSTANGCTFHIGRFDTPSVKELRELLNSLPRVADTGSLTFSNVRGEAASLHLDSANAGAVFQAASQFNCLEMCSPSVRPEHGITQYATDHTQGPACAIACPAATVYRNYLYKSHPNDIPGQGGGPSGQIDGSQDIAKLLTDAGHPPYWRMRNGYLMPAYRGAMAEIGHRLAIETAPAPAPAPAPSSVSASVHTEQLLIPEPESAPESAPEPTLVPELVPAAPARTRRPSLPDGSLAQAVHDALRVGVHWDTEVARSRSNRSAHTSLYSTSKPNSQQFSADNAAPRYANHFCCVGEERHRVTQVFCSALPVAYSQGTPSRDWEVFATSILRAAFEATLLVAAVLSRQRGRRVTVFLTPIGGGAFGNRTSWIFEALWSSLRACSDEAVDAKLVHFSAITTRPFSKLETKRSHKSTGACCGTCSIM